MSVLPAEKSARIGNFIVDSVVLILIAAPVFLIVVVLDPQLLQVDSIVLDLLYIAMTFLYYFLFELFLQKTPAKYLTRTRVVHIDGSRPSAGRVALRTLLRFIPFDVLAFLFGSEGIHDLLSKTTVIKDQSISIL